MNEPDRLIDNCDDEFVRSLLSEGRRPVESKQRTLAVLAAVGAGGAVFSKVGWAAAATWKNAAVALLVAGTGAVTYQWVVPAVRGALHAQPTSVATGLAFVPDSNAREVEAPIAAQPVSVEREPERLSEAPSTQALRGKRSKSQDATANVGAGRKGRDASGASQPGSTLSAEVSLLDKARVALRAGHPGQALAALDKYSADYPNGALQKEAELVRIPALYQSGRRAEASTRAKRVLAKNPNSLVADQLRVYVSP